jgi:hypothetical protein
MQLVKTISTDFDKLKHRIVKFLRFGMNDHQTSKQAAPYGVDSNPIKDMIAVYSATSETGNSVILGYLNKDMVAEPGEIRLFSTETDGGLKAVVFLKKNGHIWLNGAADNLVRYNKLNQNIQAFAGSINAELVKINTAILALGGTYQIQHVTVDIQESKVESVKVP